MSIKLKEFEMIGLADSGVTVPMSGTPLSVDSSGRDGVLCPNCIGYVETDGSVDRATAAQTQGAGAGGANKLVFIVSLFDSKYRPLPFQYLAATEGGYANVCSLKGRLLRASEDADGFSISEKSGAASVSYVPGTVSPSDRTESNTPRPYSNDLLDSSFSTDTGLVTGTVRAKGYHAFDIIKKDPALNNNASPYTYIVQVGDTWCYSAS